MRNIHKSNKNVCRGFSDWAAISGTIILVIAKGEIEKLSARDGMYNNSSLIPEIKMFSLVVNEEDTANTWGT